MDNIDGEQKGAEGNWSYVPPAQSGHNLLDRQKRKLIRDHSPLIMSTLALIISFGSLLVTYRSSLLQTSLNAPQLTFEGATLEQDSAESSTWAAHIHLKNAARNLVTISGITLRLNVFPRDSSTFEGPCTTELAKRPFIDHLRNDEIGSNETADITTKIKMPDVCRGNVEGPFFGLAVLNGIDQSGKEFTQIVRIDSARANLHR